MTHRADLVVVACGASTVDRECAQDAARLVGDALPGATVVLAGKGGTTKLTDELIAQCDLYVQPGGGELEPAYKKLSKHRKAIRRHVRAGGGYLGLCLGGYLAGHTPGFGLLPGDTDQYVVTDGAEVGHTDDTVIEVDWGGRRRRIFFQDGPVFEVEESQVEVLARYRNGTVAALAADFGQGRVVVCGPHPEATKKWFKTIHRWTRYSDCTDLGHQLVRATFARGARQEIS